MRSTAFSRTAATVTLAVGLTVLGLSACTTGEAAAPGNALTGTTWSGTDSLDRPTTFTFDADGTVDVTYFDDAFDDELDTWELSGTTVTVEVYQSEEAGTASYSGTLRDTTIDLDASSAEGGDTWTVVLTKQ